MIRVQGTLLSFALSEGGDREQFVAATAELRAVADPVPLLPVVLQVGIERPRSGETWVAFKDRVAQVLGSAIDRLHSEVGASEVTPLFAGNALATALTRDQIAIVNADPRISVRFAELDPLLPVVAMDEVVADIGLAAFVQGPAAGGLSGAGVRVAVLDSGIDAQHPALTVHTQVETAGESTAIPGSHGTHCAGILASRDPFVPGVAPDIELIDVKVLRANGTGRHTSITKGVDEALDLGVAIMSMSLGFNHLPPTVSGGHGWQCPDGRCPLCLAVDNAVAEGVLAVVAAGNEHERCQQARLGGSGLEYDTEMACPGQAAGALTVGSHHKHTHRPAWTSSSGPTAYGSAKPDLAAPGVDVLSTIPIPRDAQGVAQLNAPRALRFGAKSGTSMATPVVAGICALLIEQARKSGTATDPETIRATLLGNHVSAVGGPSNVLGAGRLALT